MTTFEVVDAKPWHAGEMARKLRAAHRKAISKAAINVHRQLAMAAGESVFCRAWLIDGKLAALGGVQATMSSAHGYIWLALTDEATRHPLALIREAKRQLAEIMETKRELATTVVADDGAACRFARFLGFHTDHGQCKDNARTMPTLEIFGVSVIPMGYHAGEGW